MKLNKFRNWATPLIIGAIIVMATTGTLMFFHVNFGIMKTAHEYAGLTLVFGVIFHVIANRTSFKNYFKKPLTVIGIAIIVIACGSTFFIPRPSNGTSPIVIYLNTMQDVSVDLASQIMKTEPETLKQKLESKGYEITSTDQTLKEVAVQNKANFFDVLEVVLVNDSNQTAEE